MAWVWLGGSFVSKFKGNAAEQHQRLAKHLFWRWVESSQDTLNKHNYTHTHTQTRTHTHTHAGIQKDTHRAHAVETLNRTTKQTNENNYSKWDSLMGRTKGMGLKGEGDGLAGSEEGELWARLLRHCSKSKPKRKTNTISRRIEANWTEMGKTTIINFPLHLHGRFEMKFCNNSVEN